jgi:hypothetical protein
LEHARIDAVSTEHLFVAEHMTTQAVIGSERIVVRVHTHDVVIARDRPEWAVIAARTVVHRGFGAHAREVAADDVVLVQARVADIDVDERERVGIDFEGHRRPCGRAVSAAPEE